MLDLVDVINNEGYIFKFSREYKPDAQEFMGSKLLFEKPVIITGYAKNMHGIVEIYASVKGEVKTECARCSGEAVHKFLFDYTDTVAQNENDEGLRLQGTKVDLGEAVFREILSKMPITILCTPMCKGLCPKCGVNLNKTTCDCTSFESDAVWEKLKQLNLKDEV